MLQVTLNRLAGYRHFLRKTTTPNYSLNRHAPDQVGITPSFLPRRSQVHCSFAYSTLASLITGISGSASFHSVRRPL